ncbi:MAG: hypothetical protein ACI9N1_002613 [Flavobacteriales bacterium]|jgi:hypothetical protein
MIKVINSITVILLIIVCIIAFIQYDEDMDVDIPFVTAILTSILIVLTLFLAVKLTTRWQAIALGLKNKGYNLTLRGFYRVLVAEGVSLLYYLTVALFLFTQFEETNWFVLLCLGFFLEGVGHMGVQIFKNPFKILLNERTITTITNELKMVRWSDLKKIESRHNDIHFIDNLGRVTLIDTELIEKSDKTNFIDSVTELAHKKNIFCSIDCRRGYYDDEDKVA